jgi:hypothetical protein
VDEKRSRPSKKAKLEASSRSQQKPHARPKRFIASRQAVLSTAELVEHILIHLPMLDILTAQRVCTSFRDVVEKSIAIQRKLFFIADSPYETWRLDICGNQYSFQSDTVSDSGFPDAPFAKLTPATLNPLLRMTYSLKHSRIASTCSSSRKLRGATGEASWRRMQISEPSPASISATCILETSEAPVHSSEAEVVLEEDCELTSLGKWEITLGWLVDEMMEDGLRLSRNRKKCGWVERGIGHEVRRNEQLDGRAAYIPTGGIKIKLDNMIFPGKHDWGYVREGRSIVLSKGQSVKDTETSCVMLQEWVNQWEMARSAENNP